MTATGKGGSMDVKVTFITKTEAALRQLDQAIRLFFHRGDTLAVHTLTAAAFQLLSDLGKKEGKVSMMRSTEHIRPERLAEWNAALRATQNFLKHGGRDPAAQHRYVEEETTLLLFEAVLLARQMLLGDSTEQTMFLVWFAHSFPDLINPTLLAKLRGTNRQNIDLSDRSEIALLFPNA